MTSLQLLEGAVLRSSLIVLSIEGHSDGSKLPPPQWYNYK